MSTPTEPTLLTVTKQCLNDACSWYRKLFRFTVASNLDPMEYWCGQCGQPLSNG